MLEFRKAATGKVAIVKVEMFGTARMACGQRQVNIEAPENTTLTDVALALAEVCPGLVGKVIREDLSGLMESYIFNLNGTEFVSGESLSLKHGDRLLLFSSQAGG